MAGRHVRPVFRIERRRRLSRDRRQLMRGVRAAETAMLRAACAALALSTPVAAPTQSEYVTMPGAGTDILVTRIAPDIIQFTVQRDSYVRQLNCIAIVTDHDVVLFDSLTRPSSAALVLA